MKKIFALSLCLIVMLGALSSCTGKEPSPVGTYIYEKEGFGGDFYIIISEDGTFTYYVGLLSSYIGVGEWTMDGSVLRLKDHEYPSMKFENFFTVKEDKLVFIEENSTNFMYLKVADGAVFNKASSEQ